MLPECLPIFCRVYGVWVGERLVWGIGLRDMVELIAGTFAGDVRGMRQTASTQASARGGRWRAVAGVARDAMQLCVEGG